MILLTSTAQIYLNGVAARETFSLYKMPSARNHAGSDDQTLKDDFIRALSAPIGPNKTYQGDGVYRVRINSGLGYLVYKVGVAGAQSAGIFHYHWNYNLDLPLFV